MKLKKILVLVLLIVLSTSVVCFATSVKVDDVEKARLSDVGADQVIDNDFFTADDVLELESIRIEGNAFLAAQTMELSDLNVTGSLYIAAQEVNLSDVNVDGSIFVACQNLEIENTTAKNIYSASESADFKKETVIKKNIYTFSQSIKFNAVVENDVGISGTAVSIEDDAKVVGRLSVTSSNEPEISDSSSVGEYNVNIIEEAEEITKTFDIADCITSTIKYVIVVIVLALILVYIAPGFIEKLKAYEIIDLVKSSGIGVFATICIPIIAFMLAISVVGFRFFVAVSLLYIICIMFATSISCIILSLMISKKTEKTDKKYIILYTLAVALVFGVLKQIPIISIILEIILGFIGFGSIIKALIPVKQK